jgi:hypothetical protein
MSNHRPKPAETLSRTLEPEQLITPRDIFKQITRKALKTAAIEGEIEIDSELTEIDQTLKTRIAQIERKSHIAWPGFPERLIAHGKALIEQGKRMTRLPPMPEQGRPAPRKFNSPEEWQRSLTE